MRKRIISLLLIMCMLSSAAACAKDDPVNNESSTPQETTPLETEPASDNSNYDENGYLLDSLDPSLNFNDATVNLLIRQDVANTEFYVTEDSGDVIDSALFRRNSDVEERLNVRLNFIEMPGDWAGRETMNGAIRESVAAQDAAYDVCAVLSNQLATLTMEGLLSNLRELDYLDFDKPWWAGGLLSELSVNNKLYFASGDASLGMLGGLMCVFYNKNMAADYQLPDLYDVVNRGDWTIDEVVKYTEDVYMDLDSDNSKSEGDRFGFAVGNNNQLYGFIESFNIKVLERDENNIPSEFIYNSERTTNIVLKMVSLFKDDPAFITELSEDVFAQNRALFRTGEFNNTNLYRDLDSFDFGVLPMPKWDTTQENYRTCARATYSSFCIPITAANKDRTAATLECFASESYRTVSPAYFETALKFKYSRDAQTGQMCDLIKSSVVFSFASSFTMVLNDPQNLMKNQIAGLNENWASTIASWQPVAQEKLEGVLATLDEIP